VFAELLEGLTTDRAAARARTVDATIVHAHQGPVSREPNIALDGVSTLLYGKQVRGKRVLGLVLTRAAMCDDLDSGRVGHTGSVGRLAPTRYRGAAWLCNSRAVSTPRPDVVLLDLDGTLTDAAPGILGSLRYALDSLGIAAPDDEQMRTFLGPPLAATFADHFALDEDQIRVAIAAYRERYHDTGLYENSVYDGVPELLDALNEAGVVLAIATSKPTYSATRILDHFDLTRRFAFIGGSDLEGTRHDKAAVIAHTIDELRTRGFWNHGTTAVMVGDRRHDVEGARSHGIDTIGVLWGYGSAGELLGAGAIQVVGTPRELADLLTSADASGARG